jgi:hypothetical protein
VAGDPGYLELVARAVAGDPGYLELVSGLRRMDERRGN